MLHIFNYFQNVFTKQWSLPFCAFFTTFTVVMTVLILSTDLRGHHYILFNASYLWDFEEASQESPMLVSLISSNYIIPPQRSTELKNYSGKPSVHFFKLFRKKRRGTFMELEAEEDSGTEWLEHALGWTGLLTQPHPRDFDNLIKARRANSYLAQVCISPTVYPKHAFFKNSSSSSNETLTPVPCFPLYSLIRAFNATNLDLLAFNIVTAPLQVLKSLPMGRIRIKVFGFKNHEDVDLYEDICCDVDLVRLLERWGYKRTTGCPSTEPRCYFVCARTYCPSVVKL